MPPVRPSAFLRRARCCGCSTVVHQDRSWLDPWRSATDRMPNRHGSARLSVARCSASALVHWCTTDRQGLRTTCLGFLRSLDTTTLDEDLGRCPACCSSGRSSAPCEPSPRSSRPWTAARSHPSRSKYSATPAPSLPSYPACRAHG